MFRVSRVLMLILALAVVPAVSTGAGDDAGYEEGGPLRIGIYHDYAPMSVIGPDKKPYGLLVDMWRLWSETTGVPVEFVASGWADTLLNLQTGRTDVHSGLFMNDEREEWIAFSLPIHEIQSSLFTLASGSVPPDIRAMAGKRVGVIDQSYHQAFLAANYPGIQATPFYETGEQIKALLTGEIDAVLSEVPGVTNEILKQGVVGAIRRSPVPVFTNLLHAGVLKRRGDLLSVINRGFRRIPVDKLIALERLWLKDPDDRYYEKQKYGKILTEAEENWLKANPVLDVAVTNSVQPLDVVDEHGNYTGLNADLLALLGGKLGVTLRPVFFDTPQEVVEAATQGKVAAALGLSGTSEARRHLFFTEPYAFDPAVLLVRSGSGPIHDWLDLDGMIVAVPMGFGLLGDIMRIVDHDDVRQVPDVAEGMQQVMSGRADVLACDMISYLNLQASEGKTGLEIANTRHFEAGGLKIGVHRSRPELAAILRKGLNMIGLEESQVLREKWLTPKADRDEGYVDLTPGERTWLAEHPTVTVAIMEAWPPLNFVNQGNGEPGGIGVELLRVAVEHIGLDIQFIPGQFKDNLDAVKGHDVDALMDVTPKPEREEYLNFTRAYLQIPHVIVARKSGPYHNGEGDLAGKTLALERGFGNVKYFRENHPDVNVVEYETTAECLMAVSRGEVDAYAGNRAVASFLITKELISNLQMQGRLNKAASILAVGVRKDWPELASILDKALAAVPEEQVAVIKRKWTGAQPDANTVDLTPEEHEYLREHPVIRVAASPDIPPYEFEDSSGRYSGVVADLFRLAAQRTGMQVEYVMRPWPELLEMLAQGELDAAPGLARSPEREKFLLFTRPFVSSLVGIWVRESAQNISTLKDLEGMVVAVEEGRYLAGYLASEHPEIETLVVPSALEALKAVVGGEADAYLGPQPVGEYFLSRYVIGNVRMAGYLDELPMELSLATPKDRVELHSILQKGLDAITERERRAVHAIYVEGKTGLKAPLALSEELKAWLKEHRNIQLGVNPAWMPYEALGPDGTHMGVLSEYARWLGAQLGVRMNPVSTRGRQERLMEVGRGRIDVIAGMVRTPEREERYLFTRSFLSMPLVLAVKGGAFLGGIEDLTGKTVALVQGYAPRGRLAMDHPDIRLLPVKDSAEALDALLDGSVDAVMDCLASISYEILLRGEKDVAIAATTPYTVDLSFAVRKDWPELATALDQALEALPKDVRQGFLDRWINARVETRVDWGMVWRTAIISAGAALIIFGVILWWNRKLAREIAERTRIQQELQESEGKVRAMSEAMHDGLIMIDARARVMYWNYAAEILFGISAAEALGKNLHDLVAPEEDRERAATGLEAFRLTGRGPVVGNLQELECLRSDGTRFPAEVGVTSFQVGGEWFAVGTIRDITERKEADAALNEALERNRSILSSMGEGLYGVDGEGRAVFINPTARKMLGYKEGEIKGKLIHDLIHHSHADGSPYAREDCPIYRVHSMGKRYTVTNEVLWRKDGTSFPVEYTASPLYVGEKLTGAVVAFRDITERLEAERTVRDIREELQQIFDNAQVGILFLKDGRKVYRSNDRAADIFGYDSPQRMVGLETSVLYPDREAFERFGREQYAKLGDGKLLKTEMRMRRRDGSPVWCSLSGKALDSHQPPDPDKGTIWVVDDITKRRQVEEALKESEKRFRGYFENSQVGMSVTHPDKRWLEVNPELVRMFGYDPDELMTRTWADLTHPDDLPADLERYERMLAGEIDSYTTDKRFIRKDGGVVHTDLSVASLRDENGDMVMVLASYLDITERTRAEEQLRQNLDELERFSKVVIGREERMIQLKQEINDLLARAGASKKYKIVE